MPSDRKEPPSLDPVAEPPTLRETPNEELPELAPRSGAIVVDDPTKVTDVYVLGPVIGRGGMGEVLLAHDRKIGRDVAMKRLLTVTPAEPEVARFLREARIQARLDHPAIAPVYELARDAAGRPFFTMKRLAGTTLAQLLASRSATPQRLLRALVDVCHAIDFAHSRGIVHRDVKPANIVLGDYGEVYVLDWGLARIVSTEAGIVAADLETLEGALPPGFVLGTPGYMPPEQYESPEVDGAADVYALGVILFEILAGEPLHPQDLDGAIESTRNRATNVSPSARRPDLAIAPELESACTSALAFDAKARPSARSLGDRIQDYLDGDRDLARRRTLAAALLEQARASAQDPASNAAALKLAGRAVAIDPESDAAALVTALMLAPATEPPPGLAEHLAAVDATHDRRASRIAMFALLGYFAFVPVLLLQGFTAPIEGLFTLALVAFLVAFLYRFGGVTGATRYVVLVGAALVAALSTRLAGPFIIAPGVIGIMAMGFLAQPQLMKRPVLVLAVLTAALVGPLALEGLHVLQSTWTVTEGAVISRSAVIHLGGTPTVVMLVAANVATIVITGIFSYVLSALRREAQRRVEIHAWRLQQLVPVHAPPTTQAP